MREGGVREVVYLEHRDDITYVHEMGGYRLKDYRVSTNFSSTLDHDNHFFFATFDKRMSKEMWGMARKSKQASSGCSKVNGNEVKSSLSPFFCGD